MGFSLRVRRAIQCLTKTDEIDEAQYQRKVKSNLDAVRVKIEDLRHNSDVHIENPHYRPHVRFTDMLLGRAAARDSRRLLRVHSPMRGRRERG